MSWLLTEEEKELVVGLAGTCSVAEVAAQFGVSQFYVRRLWAQAGKDPGAKLKEPETPPAPAISLSDSYVEHCVKVFELVPHSDGRGIPIAWRPDREQQECAAVVPALLRELLRLRKGTSRKSVAEIASQAKTLGME